MTRSRVAASSWRSWCSPPGGDAGANCDKKSSNRFRQTKQVIVSTPTALFRSRRASYRLHKLSHDLHKVPSARLGGPKLRMQPARSGGIPMANPGAWGRSQRHHVPVAEFAWLGDPGRHFADLHDLGDEDSVLVLRRCHWFEDHLRVSHAHECARGPANGRSLTASAPMISCTVCSVPMSASRERISMSLNRFLEFIRRLDAIATRGRAAVHTQGAHFLSPTR